MTQEEKKNLLLKDLCTRLSYGVKAKANDITVVTINGIVKRQSLTGHFDYDIITDNGNFYLKEVKPYLRDMDDLTEEEDKELEETLCWGQYSPLSYEFFYKNHINFRLPKDMFIRVTEDNNPYNIKVQ